MADNDQAEGGVEASEEAVAAPKGKLKLIIAAAVVLAIVGGGATWFFFLRHHGEEAHVEAPPHAAIAKRASSRSMMNRCLVK